MIHIGRMKAAIAAVTIGGATAAAMLIPASPAVAFSSGGLILNVTVGSPAHLVARGAAVSVPLQYNCFGVTFESFLNLTVTERVSGGAIATGGVQVNNLVCDGNTQSVILDATATGTRAFTKGTALGQASITGCSEFCGEQQDNETITIVK